jgi:phosphocarrier protein
MTKLHAQVQVKNLMGMHTRPATELVKLLQRFRSHVSLTYKKETVNARSILGILMLAMPRKAKVKLDVEGEDAEQVMEKLIEAFDKGFGDDCGVLP